MISPSDSFEYMDSRFSLDDDCCSLMSTRSNDAALKLIGKESLVQQDPDDDEMDDLLQPLEELEGDEIVESKSPQWRDAFSADEDMASDRETVSQDWNKDETAYVPGEGLDDEEVAALMKSDIMEETRMSIETQVLVSGFEDVDQHRATTQRHVVPTRYVAEEPTTRHYHQQPSQYMLVPLPIVHIMAYLDHVEQDRQVVLQVEQIVQHCQVQYQKGKKRYVDNLSGSIMEHLIDYFGGPQFQEIYHHSQRFDPRAYIARSQMSSSHAPRMARNGNAPDTLKLAIAYGMHLARLVPEDSQQTTWEMVQSGFTSLNSMSDEERRMFWSYMSNGEK